MRDTLTVAEMLQYLASPGTTTIDIVPDRSFKKQSGFGESWLEMIESRINMCVGRTLA